MIYLYRVTFRLKSIYKVTIVHARIFCDDVLDRCVCVCVCESLDMVFSSFILSSSFIQSQLTIVPIVAYRYSLVSGPNGTNGGMAVRSG